MHTILLMMHVRACAPCMESINHRFYCVIAENQNVAQRPEMASTSSSVVIKCSTKNQLFHKYRSWTVRRPFVHGQFAIVSSTILNTFAAAQTTPVVQHNDNGDNNVLLCEKLFRATPTITTTTTSAASPAIADIGYLNDVAANKNHINSSTRQAPGGR